jgi:hypothetical protein
MTRAEAARALIATNNHPPAPGRLADVTAFFGSLSSSTPSLYFASAPVSSIASASWKARYSFP